MAADGFGVIDTPSATPVVSIQLCSGCGRCVAACPGHMISLETIGFRKTAVLGQPENCTDCGLCIAACPIAALHH